jgi:hypothetical protein
MPGLLCQPIPLFLEARFDLLEALKPDRGYLASVMTVMVPMSRVIAQHTAVIARMDQVIDICEVVPDDPATPINPNFPAQHSTSLCAGQVKPLINGFSNTTSHDL